MSNLNTQRYKTAGAQLPGNPLFWKTMAHQSDIFAYTTANAGKGGPFGAQLWLVHDATGQYILVGTASHPEDSNAVVSKGLASAHAEAENLSPQKRESVIQFLKEHKNEDWKIVQVSSGESCPSCRSKQVLFANELIDSGLITPGSFFVAFKATYDQTAQDADFNDAPYDQVFRAIHALNVLDLPDGLFSLEKTIKENEDTQLQLKTGELVFNAVTPIDSNTIPPSVRAIFQSSVGQPVAVILAKDNQTIMSWAVDDRHSSDLINMTEKTAIIAALQKAAAALRATGEEVSWNLDGARLITNISEIGPKAYAESLWYNLSAIHVLPKFASAVVNTKAEELPGTSNRDLFKQVAVDYNSPLTPLRVAFLGNHNEASAAHLLWKARMKMQAIQRDQAQRINQLAQQGFLTIQLINGENLPLSRLVLHSDDDSHYDGKQADNVQLNAPN